LAGGDLNDALRRLLRGGMRMPDASSPGLREPHRAGAQRRAELLEQGDPNSEFAHVASALDDIIAEERDAIDDLQDEAANSGDDRRKEVTDDVAAERRMALDLLPDDLPGASLHCSTTTRLK